jgi:hypothetical protein
MKKNVILAVFILLVFSLAGCRTSGKAIAMPSNPSEPGFGIERTVNGNTVTLTIYQQALPSDELLLVTDLLPDGVNYISGSIYIDYGQGPVNVEPIVPDNTLVALLFAKTVPYQHGERTINYKIPNKITYQTNVANPSNSAFTGKWALYRLDLEDYIKVANCVSDCTDKVCGNDGCGGSCGTCQSGYTCSNGKCVSGGTVGIMDVLNAITKYKNGSITILNLLNIIEQYKQGL